MEKNGLTQNDKLEILAQAFNTAEGKMTIAQTMVEPIRRALEYVAVGRKLLLVDELPQGALARYEKDVAMPAYVISKRGAVPDQFVEAEEIVVPTFIIAVNPTIRLSEIKARRFYIIDRAQIKAKEAIQKEEDSNIFVSLLATADYEAANGRSQIVSQTGQLTTSNLNDAFYFIESHDLVTAKLVMSARQYSRIRAFGKTFYDEATQREILTTGLYGHLYTADIHVSSRMPVLEILVVASADTVGAMPIRQDISVLPADDPKKLRLGWVIYEEIGVVILNPYSVSKIMVTA